MRRAQLKTIFALGSITLLALCLPQTAGHAQDTLSYKARETERTVELSTPYGARQVIGDVGSDSSRYRIEIPLSSLKAATPAPATKEGAAGATDKEGEDLVKEIGKEKQKKAAMGGDGTGKGDVDEDDDEEANELGETPVKARPRKKLPSPVDPGYEYDDSDRLVLEANHLYNHGKFYEASMYVEELVHKKPTYIKGWIMKGSLMWVQGHKDLAKTAWRQALAIEPDNQEVKDLLARYR